VPEIWSGFAGGIPAGSAGPGVGQLVASLLGLAGHQPRAAVAIGLAALAASKFVGAPVHHGVGQRPPRGDFFGARKVTEAVGP